MNTSKSLDDLIAKYDDWHECDEYHIHDGTGEHEGSTPLPHDFDTDKFKQAIVEAVEGLKPPKRKGTEEFYSENEAIYLKDIGYNKAVDDFLQAIKEWQNG